MQQWLSLYKDLIGSPYNPRNSPGSKSPYPQSNSPESHAAPMEPKQYIKRQSTPNPAPQRLINSPHGAELQQTSHSSLKQPGSFSNNNVRFSNTSGEPFRTSLLSPSRQHNNHILITKTDQLHYLMWRPLMLSLQPYLTRKRPSQTQHCLTYYATLQTLKEISPAKPTFKTTTLPKVYANLHA